MGQQEEEANAVRSEEVEEDFWRRRVRSQRTTLNRVCCYWCSFLCTGIHVRARARTHTHTLRCREIKTGILRQVRWFLLSFMFCESSKRVSVFDRETEAKLWIGRT